MKYRTIVADPPWDVGAFTEWGEGKGLIAWPYPAMSLEDIKALPVKDWAGPDCHLYLWTVNEFLQDSFDVARAWGFVPSATLVWCKSPRGLGPGGNYASNVEFCLFCRRQGVPGHVHLTSALADAAEQAGLTRSDIDAHMGTSYMAGWWLSRLDHRARIPTPEQFEKLKGFLGIGDELDDDYRALREAEPWQGEKINTRWFTWPRGKHSAKPEAFLDLVERVSPAPRLELFARRDRLGWDTWGNEALNTAEVAA